MKPPGQKGSNKTQCKNIRWPTSFVTPLISARAPRPIPHILSWSTRARQPTTSHHSDYRKNRTSESMTSSSQSPYQSTPYTSCISHRSGPFPATSTCHRLFQHIHAGSVRSAKFRFAAHEIPQQNLQQTLGTANTNF